MVGPQASPPTDKRSQRRRPGRLSGRRAALVAMALTTATLLLTPVARADSSFDPVLVDVTVFAASGPQTEPVTLSQLQASYPQYAGPSMMEQYNAAGVNHEVTLAPDIAPAGTWPISEVVEAALSVADPSLALSDIDSIVVFTDADSPENPLDQADIASPSDFENPDESPVISEYGSYEYYYRPRRSGGTDANASDAVGSNAINSPNEDNPVDVQVSEAKTFPVTITASPTTITAGQQIGFQAQPHDPSGDPLTYAWDFDGAAPDSQLQNPVVTFPDPGQYRVAFQATDPNGTVGPGEVTVTVNPAATTTAAQSGTSTTQPGNGTAPTGPSQSAGMIPVTTVSTPSTVVGGESVSSTATRTTPAQTTTRGASQSATSTQRTTVTTTTRANTATTRGGTPAGVSAGGANPGAGTSGTTHASAPTANRPRTGPLASTPAGAPRSRGHAELISGRLIGGVAGSIVSSAAPASQAGASAHASGLARTAHVSRLTGFAAVAGVLALLGLGVGRELSGRQGRDRGNRPRTA
jgi:PKD repeat protein